MAQKVWSQGICRWRRCASHQSPVRLVTEGLTPNVADTRKSWQGWNAQGETECESKQTKSSNAQNAKEAQLNSSGWRCCASWCKKKWNVIASNWKIDFLMSSSHHKHRNQRAKMSEQRHGMILISKIFALITQYIHALTHMTTTTHTQRLSKEVSTFVCVSSGISSVKTARHVPYEIVRRLAAEAKENQIAFQTKMYCLPMHTHTYSYLWGHQSRCPPQSSCVCRCLRLQSPFNYFNDILRKKKRSRCWHLISEFYFPLPTS